MMKNKIITLLLVAIATITNAQNTFTVKILDSENNEVLIGASLVLKGTTNGVSTDVTGLAILKNIPNGEQIINISFIGYEDKNLIFNFPIESKKVHTVLLSASDTEIDEIDKQIEQEKKDEVMDPDAGLGPGMAIGTNVPEPEAPPMNGNGATVPGGDEGQADADQEYSGPETA